MEIISWILKQLHKLNLGLDSIQLADREKRV